MMDRFARQSFLGERSEEELAAAVVAVAGLGGGGSHIVQQLAHVGITRFILFDADIVEDSNLNRLVGGREADAEAALPKVEVATRLILGVNPRAQVIRRRARWQDEAEYLNGADVVLGCVDTAQERDELERHARRYLIPYIDIGLDVTTIEPEPPQMAGQVFVSLPGGPCMWCARLLTAEALAKEAARYGDAGGRPQVVWANGVLASTAVGVLVDLLTGWTRAKEFPIYLSYEANRCTVKRHVERDYMPGTCVHFPLSEVGPPRFVAV